MLFGAAIVLLLLGAVVAAVGYLLNMSTPMQQPLPVVGGGMVLVGVLILLIFF